MGKRLAVAAAFVAASVGLGASPAGAYTRNAAPSFSFVACYPAYDLVSFSWSMDAGKPLSVSIAAVGGSDSTTLKIPGSRGSKGNWGVVTPFDLQYGSTYLITLYGRAGDATHAALCNDG